MLGRTSQQSTPQYLLGILLLLCLPAMVYSQQNQIKKAKLYNGNNLMLFMSGSQTKFTSELSADKKKITITIQNTGFNELPELTATNSRIESVFFQHSGKNTTVSILLKEKSGYTASLLPYSQSVSIDVFDWTTLTNAEENYRSGLIAFNNNILSVAKDYFNRAEITQHPNATAYSGFISLIEGKYAAATTKLEKALEQKSSLVDIYGGLSIAYKKENNTSKVEKNEKTFVDTFGKKPYFDEELLQKQITVPNTFESGNLVFAAPVDSTSIKNTISDDTATSDVALDQLKQLQGNKEPQKTVTPLPTSKASNQSLLPGWLFNSLLGIALALISVGLLLLRGFNKWKKDQLLIAQQYAAMQSQPSYNFSDTLSSAMNSTEVMATKAYQNQMNTELVESLAKEDDNQKNTLESEPQEKQTLFDFDDSVYQELEERKRKTVNDVTKHGDKPSVIPDTLLYQASGKVELSANILEQQKHQTAHAIESIDYTTLPNDEESLAHVAKQLGVDVNILRTKKHLTSMQNDTVSKEQIVRKLNV